MTGQVLSSLWCRVFVLVVPEEAGPFLAAPVTGRAISYAPEVYEASLPIMLSLVGASQGYP